MQRDFQRIVAAARRALQTTLPWREKAARFATDQALHHLLNAELTCGLASLEYAQRLAPSDGGITFAIGLLRLALGEKRATEPLELLAERSTCRDVLVYLALARRRFGDPDRAAAELHQMLRASAPKRSAYFTTLADEIAVETGSLGWCGLNNAGRISIGGAAAALSIRDLTILLDGAPARFRKPRANKPGAPLKLLLLDSWAGARRLTVSAQGLPLIGSPIEVGQVTRAEGFVATSDAGGITGWCWLPGECETAPEITIRNLDQPEQRIVFRAEKLLELTADFPDFAKPRQFAIGPDALAGLDGALEVCGPHGRALYGSPVRPRAAIESAQVAASAVAALFPAEGFSAATTGTGREPGIPACISVTRPPPAILSKPRGIDVIVPVYRGLKVTLACLDSVLAARELGERIVVVVDASPDAELVAALQAMAADGRIVLSLQVINRGFPATANIGLRMARGRDAVLLNSDTLVPPGWLARLRDAVHDAHDIGTATPLSNDATIFSYPLTDIANPIPDLAEIVRIAAFAYSANAGIVVDTPTGHGFCMYIRAECLAETGVLREDVFAQGYGEENDFSMRARVFGWRNVAVPGVFVGHVGSQSFTATKRHLIERNLATLNRLHVGYDGLVQDWLKADPLAESRRRIDRLQFAQAAEGKSAVLLVSHARGGGVLRHVRERAALHEAAGERALLLRPLRGPDGTISCQVEHEAGEPSPNLRFRIPDETAMLRVFLQESRVRSIELHHFIGHHDDILVIVRELGCPYDVYVHDYAWFCPRVTLTNGTNRYCGEPPVNVCASCVADHGNNIDDDIAPSRLRARSAALLQGARAVVAPSWDAAHRMERHFRVDVSVGAWERGTPQRPVMPVMPQTRRRRVCVVGAIGLEKGYETLLDTARFAAEHDLPLDFLVVGYTCDDLRLLETGRVSITGRYAEAEAVRLIRAQDADFAFLPALWPETWSYVLSQLWEAGLLVVAHDIGAPAERIAASQGGIVVPLHMPVAKLAELFLEPRLFEREMVSRSDAARMGGIVAPSRMAPWKRGAIQGMVLM